MTGVVSGNAEAKDADMSIFWRRLETLTVQRHLQLKLCFDDWIEKDRAAIRSLVEQHQFQAGNGAREQLPWQMGEDLSQACEHAAEEHVERMMEHSRPPDSEEIPEEWTAALPRHKSLQDNRLIATANGLPGEEGFVLPEISKRVWDEVLGDFAGNEQSWDTDQHAKALGKGMLSNGAGQEDGLSRETTRLSADSSQEKATNREGRSSGGSKGVRIVEDVQESTTSSQYEDQRLVSEAASMATKKSRIPNQVISTYTEHDLQKKELAQKYAKKLAPEKRNHRGSLMSVEEIQIVSQRVVGSKAFELFFALVIVLNSMQTGIHLEYMSHIRNRSSNGSTVEEPLVFFILQNSFSLLFFIELLLRWMSDGCAFFLKAWNYLDIFVVLSSLVEIVLHVFTTTKDEGFDTIANIRIMRILRITRLARIIRMVKIVRFVYALRTLVSSILSTLRSLFWAMLLLMMIVYLYGMVFAQLCEEELIKGVGSEGWVKLDKYWGSLSKSVLTLFKTVSGGVSWEEPSYALSDVGFWCVALFLVYFIFTYFAVLNVITGVFCQSAIESAQRDYDLVVQANLANKEMYETKLRQLFKAIDGNDSGEVDIKEFEEHLNNASVQAYLTSLELNSEDVWRLFKLLDENQTHSIDLDEFLTGCFRLKGPAKAIEMAEVMYEMRHTRKKLFAFINTVSLALTLLLEEAGVDANFLESLESMRVFPSRVGRSGAASLRSGNQSQGTSPSYRDAVSAYSTASSSVRRTAASCTSDVQVLAFADSSLNPIRE